MDLVPVFLQGTRVAWTTQPEHQLSNLSPELHVPCGRITHEYHQAIEVLEHGCPASPV